MAITKSYRTASIPGDGIGVDVIDATWTVLDAIVSRCGFALDKKSFSWSRETCLRTDRIMTEDSLARLRAFDAILLGAVGWPARVPDAVLLHGLLLPIRKAFYLYANVRPHRAAMRRPTMSLGPSRRSSRADIPFGGRRGWPGLPPFSGLTGVALLAEAGLIDGGTPAFTDEMA